MRRPHSFLEFLFYTLPPDWLKISSLCNLIIRVEQIKSASPRKPQKSKPFRSSYSQSALTFPHFLFSLPLCAPGSKCMGLVGTKSAQYNRFLALSLSLCTIHGAASAGAGYFTLGISDVRAAYTSIFAGDTSTIHMRIPRRAARKV
jgi:hypothetical protein